MLGTAAAGLLLAVPLASQLRAAPVPLAIVTISTVIHDPDHDAATQVQVGTPFHPRILLIGTEGTPTGTVDYKFYNGPACAGTPAASVSGNPISGGVVDPESFGSYNRTTTGSMSIKARYNGNAVYAPKNGNCESVIVVKDDPGITVDVHNHQHAVDTTLDYGIPAHPRVSVSGSVGPATGSVIVRHYTTSDCSGAFVSNDVALTNGVFDSSSITLPGNPGVHSFKAIYQGSAVYNERTSICRVFTVHKAPLFFASELHDAGHGEVTARVPTGTAVHAMFDLNGSPGLPVDGDIEYTAYVDGTCQAAVEFGTFDPVPHKDPVGPTWNILSPATMSFRVSYVGGSNYQAITGPCMKVQWVAPSTTSATLHDGDHDGGLTFVVGTELHVRTAVTGGFGTPTGKVISYWWTNATCDQGSSAVIGETQLSGGVAHDTSDVITPDAVGTYSFLSAYFGSGTYEGDSSACQTVTITAPAATANPTVKPTAKPTTAPQTSSPTGAPGSPAPSGAAASAAATEVPTDSGAPVATAGPTSGPGGGSAAPTAGGGGPTSPSPTQGPGTTPSGDGGGSGLLVLVLLLVAIALGFGFWFGRRGQAKRPPA